jgi:energy-converting hydrogenase Eha subunit E
VAADENRGSTVSVGAAAAPAQNNPAERALGFVRIATGLWLMYLTFATTLDISLHYTLPGA